MDPMGDDRVITQNEYPQKMTTLPKITSCDCIVYSMAKAKSHPLKSITFNKPHPVGGFNPSAKDARHVESFPQFSGSKLKETWRNHQQKSSPKFQSNEFIKITKNHPPKLSHQMNLNSSQPDRKISSLSRLPTAGVMGVGGSGVVGISLGSDFSEPKNDGFFLICTREIRHRSRWILFVCCFFSLLILLRFWLLCLLFIVTVVKSN